MSGTRFTKENLVKATGGYIDYRPNGRYFDEDNKFIARFRRGQGGAASFMTHLRKHWTVEDYLAEMEAGKAPLEIVKQTGYLLPHIKKWLKADGYPATVAGYEAWKAARFPR